LRWPIFSDVKAEADAFYRPSYTLAWILDGKATEAAKGVIAVLEDAASEGLNVDDYDGPRWAGRLELLETKHTAADEARFDVALTVCAMRYVAAVRVGRINPKHVQFAFDLGPKRIDLARFLRQELVNGKDVKAALAEIEPPYAGYRRAREALAHYTAWASEDDGAKLPDPGRTIFPGDRYEGVARLAALLHRVGDLPEMVPADSVYSGELVEAVKRFQERHLLFDDGNIETLTLQQLNTPSSFRVEQLRLTMERWRWLPLSFPQPPLVVNIPEFYLRGFGPKGKLERRIRKQNTDLRRQDDVPGVSSILGRAREHSAGRDRSAGGRESRLHSPIQLRGAVGGWEGCDRGRNQRQRAARAAGREAAGAAEAGAVEFAGAGEVHVSE